MKGEFSFAAVKSEAVRQRTKELSGVDPVGIKWPLTEFFYSEPFFESAATFKDMRLMHFRPFYEEEEYSFYDACAHVFPKDLCDVFVREFNIAKIYLTGLVWQDQVFGLVGIILGRDEELENRQAIESFFRQASIALARRMTEERLSRSEQRFREMITLSDKPALVFNQEGKAILVNPRFTGEFGYTQEDIPNRDAWLEMAFPDPEYRREVTAALSPKTTDAVSYTHLTLPTKRIV